MLLKRSIYLLANLLLLAWPCLAQDYENNYDVDENSEQHEGEDLSNVDYSKYYLVDTSAPLVSAQGNNGEIGFTSPIEYPAFLDSSIDFGALGKQKVTQPTNPFAAQPQLGFAANQEQFPAFFASGANFPIDYFEAAQKSQGSENEADDFPSSNPNYISHNLPLNLNGDYSSDVKKLQPKPNEDENKKANTEKYYPSTFKENYFDDSGNLKPTSFKYSKTPRYNQKLTQSPTTPYQKYSFQPAATKVDLTSLISTIAPFNPSYNKLQQGGTHFESQASKNVPNQLNRKNCRKVKRHAFSGAEREMDCFDCEDLENGSKYTHCSYAGEPEQQNDYTEIQEKSVEPSGELRYKRYSGDEYANTDPYEYIKSRSQKAYDEQYTKDYTIPEYYTADDGEKNLSEIQSEALAKNPANCQKKESDGMTCTVCEDPATGANYEQCSYTSAPKEQKYAYVTEKKYDSDEPEQGSETKPIVQTKEVKSNIKDGLESGKTETKPNSYSSQSSESKPSDSEYLKLEDFSTDFKEPLNDKFQLYQNFKPSKDYNYDEPTKSKLSKHFHLNSEKEENSKKEPYEPINGFEYQDQQPIKKLVDDHSYDIPKHFAESNIKEKKAKVKPLESGFNEELESAETEGHNSDFFGADKPDKEVDEYHFKLFPEFYHEESQQAQLVAQDPSVDATRKDVEEVLAEFSKKDRTACKKLEKNKMTCYLCVDEKGIQHEECMYVSESKPQASHVAYHEVKQINSPENKNKENTQVPAATESKTVVSTPATLGIEMQASASDEHETKVKYNPKRKNKIKIRTKEDDEKLSGVEDEPQRKTPEEFIVGAEEGAYSAETKPIYSKTLGVKLPLYMIEKSEFEKEFDEFAGTH